MAELLDDTWNWRDLPALTAIAKRRDAGEHPVRSEDVATDTGLNAQDTVNTLKALEEDGLIEMRWMLSQPPTGRVVGMAGEVRRLTGLWPSPETAADRLLAALDAVIADEPEPEKRSRVEKVRDGFANAGREVLVRVATGVITGHIPQ